MKRHHKHHYRRRHKNPLGLDKDSLTLAGSAVIGAVGALALPAVVMPGSNTGVMGYVMNAASAIVLKIAGNMVHKSFGDGLLIGGLAATGLRIVKDNFGSSIPGLSAYWPSYFPIPTVSNAYGQVLASPYPQPILAAAAVSGKSGMSGTSRFKARM